MSSGASLRLRFQEGPGARPFFPFPTSAVVARLPLAPPLGVGSITLLEPNTRYARPRPVGGLRL